MPGALSLGIKWPGREVNHSPPSSAEVKEWVELYLHSLNTPLWRGAQLKHRDNCTFTFTVLGIDFSSMNYLIIIFCHYQRVRAVIAQSV
jgi:hypothetical protein